VTPMPRWAKALVITTVGLAVCLSLLLWQRSVTRRAWTSMQSRSKSALEEAKSRPGARSVLRGTPVPGNAWTDYLQADALLSPNSQRNPWVVAFLQNSPKLDRADVIAYLESVRPVLDMLRNGARRAEASYPYDWDKSPGTMKPTTGMLAYVGAAHARLLVAEGRLREAADLLLDVIQFGSDCRRNAAIFGDHVGAAACVAAFDELKSIVVSRRLSPEDLADLDRALEIADREWPDPRISMRNEMLVYRRALGSDDLSWFGQISLLPLKAWRYGFSVRRMAAAAVEEVETLNERAIKALDLPWNERRAFYEQMNRELMATSNMFVRFAPAPIRSASYQETVRAKLRLLRAAVGFLRTGTVPELDDPFGTRIRHSPGKIWSVSKDGRDENGAGSWEADGRDIVLEIK
jgi:hypothetical protein